MHTPATEGPRPNGGTRLALLTLAAIPLLMGSSCTGGNAAAGDSSRRRVDPRRAPTAPRVVINEVMAHPRLAADRSAEWVELYNIGQRPVELRGWTLSSANDRPFRIEGSLVIAPGRFVVLARNADFESNGGVPADREWGRTLNLSDSGDWLTLSDPLGVVVDSVAWSRTRAGVAMGVRDAGLPHASVGDGNWVEQDTRYGRNGRGDRGTPGARNDGAVPPSHVAPDTDDGRRRITPEEEGRRRTGNAAATAPGTGTTLTVRVLDVGQGDATLISNGGSTALVDGGPDPPRLGRLLDSLGLRDTTIDVVVLTHPHYDHHSGLRALFDSRRRLRVRYFFETLDPYPNAALATLRDSVDARVRRGEMVLRDADDPCGDGRAVCTITLRGGARLHVMRPFPGGEEPNDRSVPVKLVGPDSASFTMWLAGDAEHGAIEWFDAADYDRRPGMDVDVLKADHHGSCNGISGGYLAMSSPDWVIASLSAGNDYGHMHEQTKQLLRRTGIPWYRTDQNGTVTITTPGTPGGGYTITPSRGARNANGPVDRRSTQRGC